MGTIHGELHTFVIGLCKEESVACEAEEAADLNTIEHNKLYVH
jgi:hypothetical protein